jgi:hypothetical protein
MRTHGLFQSTPLLAQVLSETGIKVDASLYLPHARNVHPIEYEWGQKSLLRVPHFWEDDFEMERSAPRWDLKSLVNENEGLKVFDFHPIHIYLNSSTTENYLHLKQSAATLSQVTQKQASAFVQTGTGTRTLFTELTNHLSQAGGGLCMRDIYEDWRQAKTQ